MLQWRSSGVYKDNRVIARKQGAAYSKLIALTTYPHLTAAPITK